MSKILSTQIKKAKDISNDRWFIYKTYNSSEYAVVFIPPETSIYSSGTFLATVTFPKEYPCVAPKVRFKTFIYHPNVSNNPETMGVVLSGLLYNWSRVYTLIDVLNYTYNLFSAPDLNTVPFNREAEDLYRNDYEEYKNIAKQMVKKYALQ